QHQIDVGVAADDVERVLGVDRLDHVIAEAGETVGDELAHAAVVVDHENARRLRGRQVDALGRATRLLRPAGGARQIDAHRGAAAWSAVDVDAAAKLTHDAVDLAQPEAA